MKQTLRTWKVGFFLTVRSLTRGNVSTTLMTIFMMAMIFVNLIFLTSIINGLVHTAYNQIIETLTGHILVEPAAGKGSLADATAVEKELMHVNGISHVSPRTNFSAELEYNGEKGSYRGVAIDTEKEAAVTTVKNHVVAGRFLEPDDTNAVILGNQITGGEDVELHEYSLKNVQVGDAVKMTFANGLEKTYTVVGIFDNDFVQADNRFFVNADEYFSLFPELKNQASEMAVRMDHSDVYDVDAVVSDIESRSIDANIRTWKDTAGVVESFTASFTIVNFIVSIVGIIVAGITIFIVMYVDVVNRRKQIGILRAIGIAENSIAISYLLRALLYAVVGIILGMILFNVVIIPMFIRRPLHLPVGNVSLIIDTGVMYMRALALLIVSFLGAYIPIHKTLRMHIIDAIWGE
ncbi:MAG: ABC transporter permease [Candidatus Kerfeldbacteria bacterium]|nr:ABC transporter permease [Candidatus Kerfeldbacteria bacterium]